MAQSAVRKTPHEEVARLIREGGYRIGHVQTEVLRIKNASSMSRKLSGATPFTALERKALAEFFDVPEETFEEDKPDGTEEG